MRRRPVLPAKTKEASWQVRGGSAAVGLTGGVRRWQGEDKPAVAYDLKRIRRRRQ